MLVVGAVACDVDEGASDPGADPRLAMVDALEARGLEPEMALDLVYKAVPDEAVPGEIDDSPADALVADTDVAAASCGGPVHWEWDFVPGEAFVFFLDFGWWAPAGDATCASACAACGFPNHFYDWFYDNSYYWGFTHEYCSCE